jgi:hypothetical protein
MTLSRMHWLGLGLTLLAGVLTAGCAGCMASRVGDGFGKSFADLRDQQVEDPDAAAQHLPPEGLNAGEAQDVVDNYHRNQQTEVQEARQERLSDNGIIEVQDR